VSETETYVIELGRSSGTFQFDYATGDGKDQMIIEYEGSILFDTGCVGTGDDATGGRIWRTQNISYSGMSIRVTVRAIALCEGGPFSGWDFIVHCPTD
jgi:hypothetical protein